MPAAHRSGAFGPHETSSPTEGTCVFALILNWLGSLGLPEMGLPWGTQHVPSIRSRLTPVWVWPGDTKEGLQPRRACHSLLLA